MSTIKKILHLKSKIEKENALSPSEIEFVCECLTLKTIDDIDIYQESDTVIMLTFHLLVFQILRELAMQNSMDTHFFSKMVDVCLEKISYAQDEILRVRKLKGEMENIIIDICLKLRNKNISHVMSEYLLKEDLDEKLGICFLLLTDTQPKNRRLKILKNLEPKDELVEIIKEVSPSLRKELLNILYLKIRDKIFSIKDKIYILSLIEINKVLKKDDLFMLEFLEKNVDKIEYDHVCIDLLSSLVVGEESRIRVLKILNNCNVLDDVFYALETIHNLNRIEIKEIRPEDSKIICSTLSALYEIGEEMVIQRYLELLIHSLKLNVASEIKKEILKNLSLIVKLEFSRIEEFVLNYLEFLSFEIFEEEKKKNCYNFTEGFLILCNAVLKVIKEENTQLNLIEEIIRYSTSTILSGNENIIRYVLRMILDCKERKLQKIIYKEILKYSIFLRNVISDEEILEELIEFLSLEQNNLKTFDISLLLSISNFPTSLFFKFISTFSVEEISSFFTVEFLDQLVINKEEGIKYFITNSKNINISKFIIRNLEWFNRFFRDTDEDFILEGLIKIYNNVQNNFNDIKFKLVENKENFSDEEKNTEKCFLIPKIFIDEFFQIYTKLVLLTGEVDERLKNIHPGLIKKCLKGYSSFLKSRIMVKDNVEQEIKGLVEEDLIIDDLLSFYKVTNDINVFCNSYTKLTYQIILSSKNNELFLCHFENGTIFEKYLLFTTLEKPSNEIKYLIQNEIIHLLEIKERTEEERLLLESCYYGLLHFDNIEEVMVLINAFVKEGSPLLILLSIKNLLNGGETIIKRQRTDIELERICYKLMKVRNIGDALEMKEWGKTLNIENF